MSSKDTFTAEVPKLIIEDVACISWEEDLDGSVQIKVQAARDKIESDGVIVVEKDGRKTLLLLGSGKGRDQQKAIAQSKKNLSNYKVVKDSIVKRD